MGDWIQDTDCLSIEAEGAWLRVVFKCFKSKGGEFTATEEALARVCKVDVNKFASILLEWQQNDICDIIENKNNTITIISRRVKRDQAISAVRSEVGSKGGSKTQAKGKAKHQANLKQIPDNDIEYDNEVDSDSDSDSDSELYGKSENFFHGNVPDDLLELAGRLKPMPDAGEWQDYVQAEIEKIGYTVKREQPCPYISKEGKRISGRIDLVAGDGENVIGIELDDRQPRLKSIRKVETYDIGMVLLRDPKPVHIVKANVPVKRLVSSSTSQVTKEEIEEEIFNDFKLMDSFKKENPKIDLCALWVKCWRHYSVKPTPPVHAWEWKQKLMTFFNNENERPSLIVNNSKSTNDKIDSIDV
jgi:uncharacterized protein YdaU (DUF1376 family)